MRFAWATDLHFDATTDPEQSIVTFARAVKSRNVQGLLLSGDTTNGRHLVYHLAVLERELQIPVYFVLGNHDVWFSSFDRTFRQTSELNGLSPFLKCLSRTSYQLVPESRTAIVGHDGWYDAVQGRAMDSRFEMNDWKTIEEFKVFGGNRSQIIEHSRKLAAASVMHISKSIKDAVRYCDTIVVVTHVPPFVEACMHQGRPSDNEAVPWYSNTHLGVVLKAAANAYSNVKFVVLAGHTHGKCTFSVSGNMVCHVGEADYGNPVVQDVIEL
jgi:predicted phosphohydrolase